MSLAQVLIPVSCSEWPSCVGPLEGLGEDAVEVANELEDPLAQIVEGYEARPLEQPAHEDAEPQLHLVEPRAVLGRVDEADAMGNIGKELLATGKRLEDAAAAFLPEVLADLAPFGHELDQRLGHMRVELVQHEDPCGFGVTIDGRSNVGSEVVLGPRGADGPFEHLSSRDVEVGDEAQGAVSLVLELDTLDQPRTRRSSRILSFQGLDASLLVAGNDMSALFVQGLGLAIRVTDVLNILGILLGVIQLVRRCQPVLRLVRPEVGFFLKNDRGAEEKWCPRCLD
jgi:hypothetical protein